MIINDAIFAHLTHHAGLAALISLRCYPVRLPQEPTYPAVTYQRVSLVPTYSHDGDSNLDRGRWQFSCWATTHTAAEAVAAQVRLALAVWRAAFSQPAFLENQVDFYEPETGVHHIPVDATLWWKE
jgi:hypothetical protein